jgi:hypothetical protein
VTETKANGTGSGSDEASARNSGDASENGTIDKKENQEIQMNGFDSDKCVENVVPSELSQGAPKAESGASTGEENKSEEPPAKRLKMTTFSGAESAIVNNEHELPPPPPLIPAPFVSMPPPESSLIKVMFTAISPDKIDHLEQIVQRLGGRLVTNPSECTHLVTERIARTQKFMCAFNAVAHILTPNWVLESGKQNKFMPEASHGLLDLKGESMFGFSLSQSLEKRNMREAPLFSQMIFFVTKGCVPSPKVIKSVVESAGGAAVLDRMPSRKQLTTLKKSGREFFVLASENDLHLCGKFFDREVPVLSPEFVFTSILKQDLRVDSFAFKKSLEL